MRFRHIVPALVGAAAAANNVATDDTAQDLDTVVPGSYIVEFEGSQSSTDLLSELRDVDIHAEPRMDLSFKLFQGASFTVTNTKEEHDETVITAKIAQNRRVKNVWPVRPIRVPDDRIISVGHSNINDLDEKPTLRAREAEGNSTYGPHIMAQIDKLHEAGYTGKGLRIGIIDSGVDYTHPDLGGCFGPGCLVSYGYDLVGIKYGVDYEPDDDPIDTCFGHGTHVAGIIAARPNALGFSGVAPDVELGAYRAMDCLGGSSNDVMIAAFNRAYEDGSDIITASIGLDGGWPTDPWSIAVQRIVEAGVSVIIAAGNSGEAGIFTPSNPASAKGAGSIASVNTHETPLLMVAASYEVVGAEGEFGWIAGAPEMGNVSSPLYWIGQEAAGNSTIDACSMLPDDIPNLSEFVVLVSNGGEGCEAYTQALNILNKGGDKVLFYHPNNQPEFLGFLPPDLVGSGLITLDQGKAFIEQIQDGKNITVTFKSPEVSPPYLELAENPIAGGLASFWTSWGPNWDLSINPSFGAPGSQILSTFPVALGSYAVQEGTSMACPFAAATVALLAQAKGTRDPHTLASILTSTAQQLPWFDNQNANAEGRLAPVPQVGSGLLQAWDAFQAKGVLSVRGISFNDSDNHLPEASFTLKNTGKTDATYELGHSPALTFYSFNEGSKTLARFPNAIADGAAAKLAFEQTTVRVPAGESVVIKVNCEQPANVEAGLLPVYSGYITLNGTNGDNLVLPYQGVAASMLKDTETIDADNLLGTSLARNGDRPAYPVSADTVFTFTKVKNATDLGNLENEPWPVARAVINVATAWARIDLIPLNDTAADLPTQKWLGYDSLGPIYASEVRLQPRGSLRAVFLGLLDDLTIVPEGYYKIVVSALKLLGDATKDEDWDRVELVPFYVKYKQQ